MNGKNIVPIVLTLAVMGVVGCATDPAQTAAAALVRVNKEQAARAALAKAPGRIREAELDNDSGKPVWWFYIASPGSPVITEVSVDAITGGVISVATETPGN